MNRSVLRAATWNVQEFKFNATNKEGWANLHPLLAQLDRLDILALQEVPFDAYNRSALINLLRSRTALSNVYTQPLSPSMFDPNTQSGLAILSLQPLQRLGLYTLPNPHLSGVWDGEAKKTFDKGLIAGMTNWQGQRLTVASVHSFPFHLFGREADDPAFAGVWRSLAAHIEELPGDLRLVCGDFNTRFKNLVLQKLSRPLDSLFTGISTYDGQEADDIFCSQTFEVVEQPTTIGTSSDHRLCMAAVALRTSDAAR